MVFFESPRRLAATLAELSAAFGPDRRAVVCRELTKTHEEVRRGTLAELAEWAEAGTLGEITLVVGGSQAGTSAVTLDDAIRAVTERVRDGQPRRDAIASVATELGLPRRELYNAVVTGRAE
jgi:16S rRNA (cytidine1402-2'-O)-methyltransferase